MNNRRARTLLLFLLLLAAGPLDARAKVPSVPTAAQGEQIDPAEATRAYLARLPQDRKARSDAYFEGGYWLFLWGFLFDAAIFLLLLQSGLSARLRSAAARLTRRRALQPALYAVAFIAVVSVVSFPLAVYADFFREHQYGLSTQSFAAWLGDQLKTLAISLVAFPIAVLVLYAVFRRAGRSWWIWGTIVVVGFYAFAVAVGPVYIAPLFNTYTPLKPGPIRNDILRLAHANGIGATEVYEVDASRQTTRVSANVSGVFGTERIALSDNLLNRASPAAIQAVMGHEMGHYVLHHGYKMLLSIGVVIAAGFALLGWTFDRLSRRYRESWHIDGIADPAGLPLIALLLTTYLFATTPITNGIVRTSEFEADVFGLNAARQPDGFAEAALLLSDYRKMDPGPIEEFIFYDHPSGRTRIYTAMRWKAYAGGR